MEDDGEVTARDAEALAVKASAARASAAVARRENISIALLLKSHSRKLTSPQGLFVPPYRSPATRAKDMRRLFR